MAFLIFFFYICPCLLVALTGMAVNDRFWPYLLWSLFLTPLMGIVCIVYDRTCKKHPQKCDKHSSLDAICPGLSDMARNEERRRSEQERIRKEIERDIKRYK